MLEARQLTPDVEILPSYFPIPGEGFLAVNAFVIKAEEPILLDTGMGIDSDQFMRSLESVIDLKDLKWVWLTHDDADHTGSLLKVLEAAPNARLAANALAVMRMSTVWSIPMDRVYWLNPGDSIRAGDRKLTAVRPPLFDNPTTIAMYDDKSGAFFSADFFGAIIPSMAKNVDELAEGDLSRGMIGWASLDSPWVHRVEAVEFERTLDQIRQIAPKMVLSAHLPPVKKNAEQLLKIIEKVSASPPSVPPDQAALEKMLA